MATSDVSDFYHRLKVPDWLVPYFAMPAVRVHEVPWLSSTLDPHVRIYPALLVLPMGWSHSVFVAQQAHEHLVYSHTSLKREDSVVAAGADNLIDRTRHSLYIDDMAMFDTDKRRLARTQDEYSSMMELFYLPIKPSKHVPPTDQPTPVLGLVVHGRLGELYLDPVKLQTLRSRTMAILHKSWSSTEELSSLVGSWVWAMLVRRPSLSALHHVYRFIRSPPSSRIPLWSSVRAELATVMALSPLLRANLLAPWCPEVLASDASSTGGGVVRAAITPSTAVALSCLPPLPVMDPQRGATTVQSLSLPISTPGLPLVRKPPVTPVSLPRADDVISSTPTACVSKDVVPAFIATRCASMCSTLSALSQWSTVAAFRWWHKEQINSLETRAAGTALRFAISRPSFLESRLILLCDSTTVVGSLAKGRTSSPRLIPHLRRIQAMCLAAQIRLYPVWLHTSLNPADEPSRKY